MLQAPGSVLPSSCPLPSGKKRSGNMLDLKIHLVHLCPHGETIASLTAHGTMPLRQPPRCLICRDVSVSKKTRPGSFEEEGMQPPLMGLCRPSL
jgi:hypothetical protein